MERTTPNEPAPRNAPAVPSESFSLMQIFAITMSFIAGILIVVGVASAGSDSTALGPSEAAHSIPSGELARAVGEPSNSNEGEDTVVAEVAGVTCEVERLAEDATSAAVLDAWNSAVESPGDACAAPFAETLGSAWVMTDAELSIFGEEGSLYEFTNSDGPVNGLTIFLLEEDASNDEAGQLQALIDSVWGADTIDWERNCTSTDSPWSGLMSPDGLAIEVSRCSDA